MSHKQPAPKGLRIGSLLVCAALASAPSRLPGQSQTPAENPAGGQTGGDRQAGGSGRFGGQPPVSGIVTSVAAGHATVKTQSGDFYQIFLGPNTRLMRDRQPVKASDIQVGDMLTAIGEADAAAKTVHAALAMDVSAEQVKKMRAGLGKEWIAGRVTSIDDTMLTIRRVDNVTQKIEVDETTSFRRSRGRMGAAGMAAMPGAGGGQPEAPPADPAASGESITLVDIKVGDNVSGRGGMKGDVFVPTVLAVSPPSQGGGRRRGGSADPAGNPASRGANAASPGGNPAPATAPPSGNPQ